MIIAGWKKKAKQLAYLGVKKCPHCNNYCHFYVIEMADKPSLFFVPVAKLNKKHYAICSLCEICWEVDEGEELNKLLTASVRVPTEENYRYIWRVFEEFITRADELASDGITLEEGLNGAIVELNKTYSKSDVEHVYSTFLTAVTDEDTAR